MKSLISGAGIPRGVVVGVLLAFLVASCGPSAGSVAAGSSSTPRAGGITDAASGDPSAGATAAGEVTGSAFPSAPAAASEDDETPRPCTGLRFVSPHRGTGSGPRIWVRPDLVQGWGCGNLVAGRECRIGWSGSYAGTGAENYIRFVAWERGKHTPVKTTDVGPLPLEGMFTSTSTKFAYVVGKTDKVRFYLQLLDAAKVPIATSDTFVYNVDCKG